LLFHRSHSQIDVISGSGLSGPIVREILHISVGTMPGLGKVLLGMAAVVRLFPRTAIRNMR
jgi:hypothetical protein